MEVLVTISILSILAGILIPVVDGVRSKAQEIKSMNHLKLIGCQLNVFANDYRDRYPPSVATVGTKETWTWYDPRRIVSSKQRTPLLNRSMSAYLHDYIDPSTLYCPAAPDRFKYLEEMWQAGDAWDNPETTNETDPMSGNYCFYWNYEGVLVTDQNGEEVRRLFRGPRTPAGGRKYSDVLATDYFSYGAGHDNPPPSVFASCERFDEAVSNATQIVAPYWAGHTATDSSDRPELTLKAVYTDGHVEMYHSTEVERLHVINNPKTGDTWPIGTKESPGEFFIPENAVP